MSSNALEQLRRSRLRILPGSILLGNLGSTNEEPPAPPLESPPEPPSSPPPDPTEIVRLVVLGDRRVGKSSVVQKFITRRYCNPNNDDGEEGSIANANADADAKSVRSGRSHKSGRSSRSHRSHRHHRDHRHRKSSSSSLSRRYPMSPDGSHVSARSADTSSSRARHDKESEGSNGSGDIELIKAEYHKKDVTMWLSCSSKPSAQSSAKADASKSSNAKKRSALRRVSENHPSSFATDDDHHSTKGKAIDEQSQTCARVQVWDATGQDTMQSEETDDSNAQAKTKKDSKWSQIFRNAAGALIICTLGEDEGDTGGMHGQYLDRQSIMDHLDRRITRWLGLVDAYTSSALVDGAQADNSTEPSTKHRIPVTLILNKSDQISNVLSSSDWVRVGAQMERLCERLGIDGGWYTSTCIEPQTVDIAQDSSTSASTASGAWNEDHDGAEMAFLSLVRSNLLTKRGSNNIDSAGSGKDSNGEMRNDKSPSRKNKGHKKGNRQSSSRRSRSNSRSRPRAAPNFPIDP